MKNLFLLMVMTTLFIACKKLYPDDELSIERENYNGDEIRLNGYYYRLLDDGRIFPVLFFYSNGVLIDVQGNGDTFQELEEYINGVFIQQSSFSYDKLDLGVFLIKGDNIKFEKWYSGNGPSKPAYVSEGKILNDTTFLIFKSYRMKNGKQKEVSPENETYHFKAFSPKPDSTNQFIE